MVLELYNQLRTPVTERNQLGLEMYRLTASFTLTTRQTAATCEMHY